MRKSCTKEKKPSANVEVKTLTATQLLYMYICGLLLNHFIHFHKCTSLCSEHIVYGFHFQMIAIID